MADHPIPFMPPMIRALIDGRKTQTRRILNPQPEPGGKAFMQATPSGRDVAFSQRRHAHGLITICKPTYAIGDRLWVKEDHWAMGQWEQTDEVTARGRCKMRFVRDAETDAIAALHYGPGWRAVDTMPQGKIVSVLTMRGLIKQARIPQGARWIKRSDAKGPRRIQASNPEGGVWWCVAWRDDHA